MIKFIVISVLITLFFFLFVFVGIFIYTINKEGSHKWLFLIMNTVVIIFLICLFLIAFKEKIEGIHSKKKITYIDGRRAKLCQTLGISGILIMVCIIIIILYLEILLPENMASNILGFQSPIAWVLIITLLFGFLLGILGLRMVLHGALEQIE